MFDIDFQRRVVKLLATNIKFGQEYGALIRREYFDIPQLRNLFRLIYDNVLHYEKEMDKEDVFVAVDTEIRNRGFTEESAKDLYEEAKAVFRHKINNEQFIIDNFLEFAKTQELKDAVIKACDIIEENRPYEEIASVVEKALTVGAKADNGMDFSHLMNIQAILRKKYDPSKLIRTGFMDYDLALQGGMAPGEVHVIQAPPKTGKSTFGACVGANSVTRNKTVYHITLEIGVEEVLHKYSCRMSKLTYQEVLDIEPIIYQQRMEKFRRFQNNLFVNYWTEGTVNTLGIRSWISRQRSKTGKNPDLIIIDYDDLLLPTTGAKDMYEDAGQIYQDLKQLADYFKCPVLTFAQPKREAWYKYDGKESLILADELAHSAKKAHKAFSISSLNFTRYNDIGCLYVDLNRRGVSNKKIKLKRELNKAMFYQWEGSVDEPGEPAANPKQHTQPINPTTH